MNGHFFTNQSNVAILAGQIFPFFDANVTFETSDRSNQHKVDFYAERCTDVPIYEELVGVDVNCFAPGSYPLKTDYLLAGSSITISINTTDFTNAEIIPTDCLSRILIFEDPFQFAEFINTSLWNNASVEVCVKNTSFSYYTFDITETAHYYFGLYIPSESHDLNEICYELSGRAFRYNITGFKPSCLLTLVDRGSCTASLEKFGGHGPDVCLFALWTPDIWNKNKYILFSYYLSTNTLYFVVVFVPMGILFLILFIMLMIFYCYYGN